MSDAAANLESETSEETEGSAGGEAPRTAPKQGANDAGTQAGEARDVGGVGGERLRSFVERIERLEEEKAHLAEDIKEVYAELKGVGFDAKTVRKVVSLRKMDNEKRRESEELLDLYKTAIGMV